MHKAFRWIFVLIAVGGLAASAHAREWHVSPKGDDANNGTAQQPLRTLQKAESVVQPGDVVLIGGGIYRSEPGADNGHNTALLKVRVSGRPEAWITWKAKKGEKPELRSSQWSAIEINGSYHIFDGLTVTGQNDEIALSKAIESSKKGDFDWRFNTNGIFVEGRNNPPDNKPHHITVRNCTVSKMPGGGITFIEADYITVEDNKVFENAWYMKFAGSGITNLTPWPFDDKPGYHIIFRRNVVWNNKVLVPWEKTGKLSDGNGILLDVSDQEEGTGGGATNPNGDAVVMSDPAGQAPKPAKPKRPVWKNRALIANNVSAFNGGSGIHTFRTSRVDIINNTTYWNGSVVDYEELFPNRSNDITILNNVIVPRPGGRVTSNNRNTNIRWDYNLYPVAQDVIKGPNDIVADPLIVNPYRDLLRADFRLAKGSPAIDSGTDELAQAEDVTGARRPLGKGRDRGAYER